MMTPSEDRLREMTALIARLEIRTVAIIDDMFAPPAVNAAIHRGLGILLEKALDGGYLDRIATACHLLPEELEDPRVLATPAYVDELWKLASEPQEDVPEALVHDLRATLFQSHLDAREPLNLLRSALECLGIAVLSLAPDDQAQLVDAELWFFDLLWATEQRGDLWANAAAVAKQQYQRMEKDPPFFVLMSSDIERLEEAQDDFRKHSGVPVGYFLPPLPKNLLTEADEDEDDSGKFFAWLETALRLKHAVFRRDVYGLKRAIVNATKTAVTKYTEALHRLGPEDFSHIYRYSLQDDGAPLGSYMLWLFEPLFEHYLKQDEHVIDFRRRLDELKKDDVPEFDLARQDPTTSLSEIHHNRMWMRVDEHEHGPLQQGDLLRERETSLVYLVLNADCDLAYTTLEPREPNQKARLRKDELMVLLLPGAQEGFSITQKFTEFYGNLNTIDADYKLSCVNWMFHEVRSERYGTIDDKYTRCGWRLRRPYISEIAQQWSHQITRVGVPASPSVIEKTRFVEIRYRASGDQGWRGHPLDEKLDCYLFPRGSGSNDESRKTVVVIRDPEALKNAIQEQEFYGSLDKGGKILVDGCMSELQKKNDMNGLKMSNGICAIRKDCFIMFNTVALPDGMSARFLLVVASSQDDGFSGPADG